jgi:hypothetical protein
MDEWKDGLMARDRTGEEKIVSLKPTHFCLPFFVQGVKRYYNSTNEEHLFILK